MKNVRFYAVLAFALVLGATLARAETRSGKHEYAHGDVKLHGWLAADESSKEKRPGVLVVPEWWGLGEHAKESANRLAKMGYVALAVDMYGEGKTTNDPKVAGGWAGALKGDRKLMRARVTAALDELRKHPLVDPSRIAAIGYCFGGTTVLELARSGAPVVGVVSFHGALDTPDAKDAKNIKGKILVCHGADDGFVPDKDVAAFADEMRQANVDWQMISYGGAVHSFTNPEADKHGIKGIAYNAAADRRSWEAMKQFFAEVFAE